MLRRRCVTPELLAGKIPDTRFRIKDQENVFMQYEIKARPAASVVDIRLSAGESITAEVGAMVAMTSGMTVETTSRTKGGKGGMMKGLKRMFAGENFFLNHFSSHGNGQSLILGPQLMGDIIHYPLNGTLIVQGSSWLASDSNVEIDASWQGLVKHSSAASECSGSNARGTVTCFSAASELSTKSKLMANSSSTPGTLSRSKKHCNFESAKQAKV